jgi:hypothetical protein
MECISKINMTFTLKNIRIERLNLLPWSIMFYKCGMSIYPSEILQMLDNCLKSILINKIYGRLATIIEQI